MNSRDIRPVVDRVCADMGLDQFAGNTVEMWVQNDPSTWATCCLSDCDPCNGVLRKAARKVLKQLKKAR